MDIDLTGHIAGIPEEQFDHLDPSVGVLGCYAKVKLREADGRWRVTYVRGTDAGLLTAAVPLYASRMRDWPDPAYDPRTWALPPTVSEGCTAARCLVVGSFEERCSALHVGHSAREPGQLRRILAAMAQEAARQDRYLAFPYFPAAARDALSAAASGRIVWAPLGPEAIIRDLSDPGWEASLSKRIRYNLRHDRELIEAAAITGGHCSWAEIEDTASELIAKHNVKHGHVDHPEFVRARQRLWAGFPQAEHFVFTVRSPVVSGVEIAVVWRDELDLREMGLAGEEGPDRRAAYLDLAFHQPIRFAQARGLRLIRFGMEAGKVKAGRGAILQDLYGGVMTAADARRFADEHY
ncbi:MAG TPA: hypothetical protein VKS82_06680 [Streptosporangiaceae bacterium]|nr:hypothetical protein [Streptosporangiaceae bacterium]